ncbi:MAG: CoA-binding protein [Chloroflexi bacterium]|nr:CoA-binding protein [Chloroflexota bacterium]
MALSHEQFAQFEGIFYPRSVAVVGATADRRKIGYGYMYSIYSANYQGKLYPVNPRAEPVLGLPGYASLKDIPGPVDHVIVCIPASNVIALLKECGTKGVKSVQFFTAGFRELGTEEGWRLEGEVVKEARSNGLRLIGPNCIGVYSPEIRLPYGVTGFVGEVGPVAVISQSGGHADSILELGLRMGVRFNKIVSYGNGSDLDSTDYLEYLAQDPRTQYVGAYMEGVNDSRRFMQVARGLTREKPFVVWKGGLTEAGARQTNSHTGSLASPAGVWAGALRQVGALQVMSMEDLDDTLLAFQQVGRFTGTRLAVVTGMTGGGGGQSVSSADACSRAGFSLPALAPSTYAKLTEVVPPVGSILRNPLDISGVGWNLDNILGCLEAIASDPAVDMLMVHHRIYRSHSFMSHEAFRSMNSSLASFRQRIGKPLVLVSNAGVLDTDVQRLAVEEELVADGLPVFPTFERAANAVGRVSHYWRDIHGRSIEMGQTPSSPLVGEG